LERVTTALSLRRVRARRSRTNPAELTSSAPVLLLSGLEFPLSTGRVGRPKQLLGGWLCLELGVDRSSADLFMHVTPSAFYGAALTRERRYLPGHRSEKNSRARRGDLFHRPFQIYLTSRLLKFPSFGYRCRTACEPLLSAVLYFRRYTTRHVMFPPPVLQPACYWAIPAPSVEAPMDKVLGEIVAELQICLRDGIEVIQNSLGERRSILSVLVPNRSRPLSTMKCKPL